MTQSARSVNPSPVFLEPNLAIQVGTITWVWRCIFTCNVPNNDNVHVCGVGYTSPHTDYHIDYFIRSLL